MGSSGEYGKAPSPHKEIDKCYPKSVYSRSKYLSSQYLLKLYKKYKFPLTVLRLYQAYGERQDINRLIPIVITSCIKDEEFPCSDGKQFRDFVYISDVVQAIIKSIHSKKSKGQVFNLGSSKPIKIKKLILMIRKNWKGQTYFWKNKIKKRGKFKKFIHKQKR